MSSFSTIGNLFGSIRRMATDMQSPLDSRVTWSQILTDFTVVLKSGKELKCHKFVLASNSEYFRAMLTNDMEDSKTDRVKMDGISEETVVSFLEYLYSESLKSEKTLALVRNSVAPNKYIYKRSFDEEKLTLELLSMAHFYRVEDMEMDCTEHLKETICDGNVMDIWMEADRCDIKELREMAIEHLVNRPSGQSLQDVHGFNDAFQDHDRPLKDLLRKLIEKNSNLQEEIFTLKGLAAIKITVTNASRYGPWTEDFYVRPTDKISSLLEKVRNKCSPATGRDYCLTLTSGNMFTGRVERDTTFLENSISRDTTLYLWNASPEDAW